MVSGSQRGYDAVRATYKFEDIVKPRLEGNAVLCRFADDAIILGEFYEKFYRDSGTLRR
jgi:hypothetical protein